MGTLKEQLKVRPLASDKWAEIADIMSTHIAGRPPTRLYKTRRPLESSNEYALTYREENFQPITKQPFLTAISAILESANHIYAEEKNVTDTTRDYLADYQIKVAGKTYSHKDYIINFVGFMLEQDPNAVLVHLPRHPSEELIPDYREELPNFNNVLNQNIEIEIQLVSSDRINFITADELWYDGGEWIYKVEDGEVFSKPFYYILTKESTRLAVPVPDAKEIYRYEIIDYYANDLEDVPFDVVGNNPILEEVDGEVVEYHEPTYSGGVAIANKLLGLDSDSDILQTRYTYPEKYMHMERCGHPQCIKCTDPESPYAGLFVNYDYSDESSPSCTACNTCNGTGQVAPDTSPLGTHWIAKSDLFDEEGRFTPLIGFVVPPIEAPKYMAEQVDNMFARMERALFIMNQNMTNQSGESKAIDVRQKVQTITRAVTNIYSIYEKSLNTFSGFLRQPEDVEIILPPDFNIKTSEDITIELSESQGTSSVYTACLTTELLLKKFGNTAEHRKALNFLEMNDKLYGMTIDEIIKMKAMYGPDLSSRDQIIHDKGWAVLMRLAKADDFITISDEELKTRFDAQIDIIAPVPIPVSPIA